MKTYENLNKNQYFCQIQGSKAGIRWASHGQPMASQWPTSGHPMASHLNRKTMETCKNSTQNQYFCQFQFQIQGSNTWTRWVSHGQPMAIQRPVSGQLMAYQMASQINCILFHLIQVTSIIGWPLIGPENGHKQAMGWQRGGHRLVIGWPWAGHWFPIQSQLSSQLKSQSRS